MSWQAEYLAALEARDQREHASKTVIDAYTSLADRTASLSSPSKSTRPSKPSDISTESSSSSSRARASKATPSSNDTVNAGTTAKLQADLAAAQARRAALEGAVTALKAELAGVERKEEASRRKAAGLEAERTVLATKLRDRDEELRGKAKLLDDVQNEAVTLNLQLNVTEESNRKLARENKDLVDRWMARMGEEAERMNVESKFS